MFLIVFFLLTTIYLLLPATIFAHCPLCVAGAGAGLSFSRILGVDDSITGVWIAAFLGAMSLWIAGSIKKTYIPAQSTVIYVAILATTLLSFYQFGLISEHNGLIGQTPKLTFGMLVGGVVFYLIDKQNTLIRLLKGRVLFPYQPIVFSLGAMLVLSLGIYFLINFYI
jgi:hypothetical protein